MVLQKACTILSKLKSSLGLISLLENTTILRKNIAPLLRFFSVLRGPSRGVSTITSYNSKPPSAVRTYDGYFYYMENARYLPSLLHQEKYLSRKSICTTPNLCAKKAQKSKSKSKKLSLNVDDAEGIVDLANMQKRMEDVLEEMSQELATKVPLRITSGFIDNIMIETGKGKKVPLYQVAQVKTTSDSFLIEIQDMFPNAAKFVSSAITETGFNMQPSIKGNTITMPIPIFTHDHRSSVERIAKNIANQAKEDLRKVRQKGMIDIRNNKEGQSKDLIRNIENQVQQLTDHYIGKVEMGLEQKVKEVQKGK